MLPFQRRSFIINKTKDGMTYISDLAKALNVSEVTVRRDLKSLEEEQLVEVHHGGAVQYINTTQETDLEIREKMFSDEKLRIGKYAASLIKDGDVVFIDSGTTTQTIFAYLKDRPHVVIVTNGYKNLEVATSSGLKNVVLLGGEYKPRTGSFLGVMTENDLSRFYFDKSFIGANGVDAIHGLTNANLMESSLKTKAIKASKDTYTLIDHSKFNEIANYYFAGMQETTIITDQIATGYSQFRNIQVVTEGGVVK
ncbi:DeoR/GlpR family DNA-binding transcription regulator [Lapidilactobacillus bayanensis]|uniref:DeoR/GlpR family DNA-binding transcription regulator n=1 Tax=Lapidilactobacillus bayanensis TaxID=2485998 RepID=UPI000F7822AC|nr:DeoR/GlpR family DNA-binding transcription regulator [Lapidilactobacillus bayanensis]